MKTKKRPLEDYLEKIEHQLCSQQGGLSFVLKTVSERKAILYYRGLSEPDDELEFMRPAEEIVVDALVDDDYNIMLLPYESFVTPDGRLMQPPDDAW